MEVKYIFTRHIYVIITASIFQKTPNFGQSLTLKDPYGSVLRCVKTIKNIQDPNLKKMIKVTPFHDNLHLKDLLYLKDLKHLSPKVLDQFPVKHQSLAGRNTGSLLKMLIKEVVCGLKQFLYEGSLHGVKYIFEPAFSRRERMTWVIIMVFSIVTCTINIINLFTKSMSSPFVNVMDSLPTPIWAIPFPTVVICPQLHIKLSYANVSELDGTEEFFASLVCPQMYNQNFTTDRALNRDDTLRLQKFVVEAAPKCSDVVRRCFWKNYKDQEIMAKECCDVLFNPVFTDYGLCYAFNTLPLNGMTNDTLDWQLMFDSRAADQNLKWTLDEGYPRVFPPDPTIVPFWTKASGEYNGLSVELYLNMSDHQYSCDESSVGFNVLISSPTDHIYTSSVLRIPMERMTTIEVTPETYRTDVELINLKPEKRQCFFQSERSLEYYALYTDSNCKMDLLLTEARKTCDCVLFNWPRMSADEPICSTYEDFECITEVNSNVEDQLILAYFADNAEPGHTSRTGAGAGNPASCYPSCNDILYHSKVYYSDLISDQGNAEELAEVKKGEVTRIDVHFCDDMFLGLHRHAQYDENYFVGAVGGLMSLFLGFSIISAAELAWFAALRPLHRVAGAAWRRR